MYIKTQCDITVHHEVQKEKDTQFQVPRNIVSRWDPSITLAKA